jgi:hypothetical protein
MNEEFDWNIAPTICELNGFRWVLGPEAPESMSWDDATDWCKSVGGVLPTREILLLAFMDKDIRDSFANDAYWSSSEDNSGNAWNQDFSNGLQYNYAKYNTYLVRAVKAIKIGEE